MLSHRFVQVFNAKHGTHVQGVSARAAQALAAYAWPGNVRELRNVIERAVILAGRGFVEPTHLPPFLPTQSGPLGEGLVIPAAATAAEAERLLIEETLRRFADNKAAAARHLGLDVKTIRTKLKAYATGDRRA